uniref:Cyclic nucleotide-binding domain-containing protein n=1 Tax=Hanusia phi TaxID=3032 RepID=A0A7S0E1Q6_9CRYP
MSKEEFNKGQTILEQGWPQSRAFFIADGQIRRERVVNDQSHQVVDMFGNTEPDKFGNRKIAIGALHVLHEEPAFANAKAMSSGYMYSLPATVLKKHLESPQFSTEVVQSLAVEVRRQANQVRWLMRTPLLEQRPKKTNVIAVTIAASIESFYRSGLNAAMNARLSGHWGKLFPNMHIQCPARILYINGFKGLRQYMDYKVKPEDFSNPTMVRLGMSFAPGIVMTPLSSILEASNAGHMNPEPITTRWMRGISWRLVREVIFGLGLNQMSDYWEERIPQSIVQSEALRTAFGSMISGVLSGYLSHIPHNLSTLKLMTPSKTYMQHLDSLVSQSESRIPTSFSPGTRKAMATFAAIAFPRAVLIRTAQIVGSFIILNGTINALKYAELPTSIPTAF